MGAFDTICPPCLQVGETAPSAPHPRLRRANEQRHEAMKVKLQK